MKHTEKEIKEKVKQVKSNILNLKPELKKIEKAIKDALKKLPTAADVGVFAHILLELVSNIGTQNNAERIGMLEAVKYKVIADAYNKQLLEAQNYIG